MIKLFASYIDPVYKCYYNNVHKRLSNFVAFYVVIQL